MKINIFLLILLMLLMIKIFAFEPKQMADEIKSYVIPAATNTKILPASTISPSYLSDQMLITASPGEYKPASFVIWTRQDITSLLPQPTDLEGVISSIPYSNIDIRAVKPWYQAGYDIDVGHAGRYLTPELLLKDDSLVKVEGENWDLWNVSNPNAKNYLKVNGDYIDISENHAAVSGFSITPVTSLPISDAAILQPLDIPAGYNQQFWVKIYIPQNTPSGTYNGEIKLKIGYRVIGELQLRLQVLPIKLADPYLTYSIFYRGQLKDKGTISSEDKNPIQFKAEMDDLSSHGVTDPTIYTADNLSVLGSVLAIRNGAGMSNQAVFFLDNPAKYGDETFKKYIQSYGTTDVYLYGIDEGSSSDNIPIINDYHSRGFKAFVALNQSNADALAGILDLAVVSRNPNSSLAAKYHSYGHKIFSYANPQIVPEYPGTFRLNYGLLLWQKDYDGAMDYAYQHSFGEIWNDFDGNIRDLAFTYPTMNGVVDTIQWEGFQQGVDDVRYLTTLLGTIRIAKAAGRDTTAVEAWLTKLKASNLAWQDLDEIRDRMIFYILNLDSES